MTIFKDRTLWRQQRLIETIDERNVSLQEAKILELTLDTYKITTGGPEEGPPSRQEQRPHQNQTVQAP